jgi:hypothetical protein
LYPVGDKMKEMSLQEKLIGWLVIAVIVAANIFGG